MDRLDHSSEYLLGKGSLDSLWYFCRKFECKAFQHIDIAQIKYKMHMVVHEAEMTYFHSVNRLELYSSQALISTVLYSPRVFNISTRVVSWPKYIHRERLGDRVFSVLFLNRSIISFNKYPLLNFFISGVTVNDGKRLNAITSNLFFGYTFCAHFGRLQM